MKFAQLGSSGLIVSRIGFGNAITAGAQVDTATATQCVRAALDHGVTLFDTADLYAEGRAEEILGTALRDVAREEVVLTSKVGRWAGRDSNSGRLSRKHIMESIDASLRRLETDHVDVYQAHRFDAQTPLAETMTALADVVRSGKALYLGVSEWSARQVNEAAVLARDLGVPLVSNQPQYSLLWRVVEAEVVPACDRLGIGQVAWGPLAGGVLTGKYLPGREAPPDSRVAATPGGTRSINRWNYLDERVRQAVARLGPLAAEAGLTLPQLAVAWVLRNPSFASAVVGASRPDQLAATLSAVDVDLDDHLCLLVDEAVAPVVRRDPALTEDPLGPAAQLAPAAPIG